MSTHGAKCPRRFLRSPLTRNVLDLSIGLAVREAKSLDVRQIGCTIGVRTVANVREGASQIGVEQ